LIGFKKQQKRKNIMSIIKIAKKIKKNIGREFKTPVTVAGRAWRPQWLPDWFQLQSEANAHPHVPEERAELFIGYNTGSTEMEVLNWLYATILLLKPQHIVETGAADGLGTIALARACKANGFGRVHSIEIDTEVCGRAKLLLKQAELDQWVEYHCQDSRQFLSETKVNFDFGFFDSLCELRAQECAICMERGILHGPAIFHDTSPYRTKSLKKDPGEPLHSEFRKALKEVAAKHFEGNFCETTLSRGITILLPKRYPTAPKSY
jgi:predicted O-methyltransferase YrrM